MAANSCIDSQIIPIFLRYNKPYVAVLARCLAAINLVRAYSLRWTLCLSKPSTFFFLCELFLTSCFPGRRLFLFELSEPPAREFIFSSPSSHVYVAGANKAYDRGFLQNPFFLQPPVISPHFHSQKAMRYERKNKKEIKKQTNTGNNLENTTRNSKIKVKERKRSGIQIGTGEETQSTQITETHVITTLSRVPIEMLFHCSFSSFLKP